ncbi:MAG: hypothetical protein QM726_01275 [Chitinophagaceae bacterium]
MKTTFSLLILILGLISCKKDSTPSPSPSAPLSTTLVRVYEIDTTLSAPKDTITRTYFSYDSNNRPIAISELGSTSTRDTSYYLAMMLKYNNSSDTLASETIKRTQTSVVTIDTTRIKYLNGHYASDSTRSTDMVSYESSYTYQQGLITRDFVNHVPLMNNYSATEHWQIHQTINASNDIVYQIDTIAYSDNNPNGLLNFESREITTNYLTNPNPVHKAYAASQKEYFQSYGIGNYMNAGYAPLHLISQQTSKYSSWAISAPATSSTVAISYQYTLRSDGYPVSAVSIITQDNQLVKKSKLLFIYK